MAEPVALIREHFILHGFDQRAAVHALTSSIEQARPALGA